ncbi:hypothetical protein [Xanthomonas sp. 4461]|uniref:hypothetical protein n=1 Tax=Xanthomonas sp. 4461 TaxID=3035313 RepID=UPI002168A489|nr:hypothetical protein [Xanthomonas sp. 4461]MCS3811316.1 hypothetical protein [Xanthomonas sp. 4461]
MRGPPKHYTLILLGSLATGCGQSNHGHDDAQRSPASGGTPLASEQTRTNADYATEVNCPPQRYADVSTLGEKQLDPLYAIATFALDGKLTREEFDSNPRYAEIALSGAEFLATTDVAIRGIVDVTGTPPLSMANAAKLASKLASIKVKGRYARTGAMGTLQAKIKTCLLMIKNDLP